MGVAAKLQGQVLVKDYLLVCRGVRNSLNYSAPPGGVECGLEIRRGQQTAEEPASSRPRLQFMYPVRYRIWWRLFAAGEDLAGCTTCLYWRSSRWEYCCCRLRWAGRPEKIRGAASGLA